MKFGINAQVIIALLGALYILMVCKEKYRIEYAEGEPVAVDERETEVYSMIRDGRLTPDEAADELANLRDAGVSLTSRSISVLNVLGLTDKARADKKMKEGPKLTEKERLKLKLKLDGEPTLAVMPKPGSPDYLDEPRSWLKRPVPQHKGPDYSTKPRVALPGVRPTVMPKPGSVDFILSKARRADQPRTAVKKVEKNGKKLTMKERAIADKEAAARAGVPRPTKEKFPHKGPRPAVMPKPGSPGSADFIMNKVRRADEPRPAVMPKPGSADFIMNKARRADEPRLAVMLKPGSVVAVKAKKTSVAKAPIVAVKAEKNSIIEEEGQVMIDEEVTIEGQAMIEEGMSTGAIAGITAVSIVALIAIMIMMRRLRR